MPHPSRTADVPTKRVKTGEVAPTDRTPAEMLAVLHRIVNRQVEALDAVTHGGVLLLDPIMDEQLDATLERVCKLAREERAKEPTDEELLEAHDKAAKK
jgi:hypothetical protein